MRVVSPLMQRDRWRRWTDVTAIFAGPADVDWDEDRRLVDQAPRDSRGLTANRRPNQGTPPHR
jgi:hypothetical protein